MEERSKFKILVVDDEKSNLDILVHILRPAYTLYIATSGIEALKRVESNAPDLILLDIIMPDMNGFDVLCELKKSDMTRSIPVIFITGLNSIEDEERGFALGAVDYITKPFHHSIVKARVKTHLQIVKQIHTIEKLCMIDALTDIPNRRSFDKQIRAEWGRAIRDKSPLSMLMIDIDNFKTYNDTYGHSHGDMVLQAISKIFLSSLRRAGDFAARWGGEEFAVLLPNTALSGALEIAEIIRSRVEAIDISQLSGDPSTCLTISIGVSATIPSFDSSMSAFIGDADKALYVAKTTGKNQVCS